MTERIRLSRYLSQAGIAARRKADFLIEEGRVRVNGVIVRKLGSKVDPIRDQIDVDGEGVAVKDSFYVLLNKPKGCITAVTDDRGRPTVMEYLPNLPVHVRPVGRLDFYSEGVLLLTNDGELAARLLSPSSHIAKTYHVKVRGTLAPEHLARLAQGITLEDGTVTRAADVALLPSESRHSWVAITLYEGKSRQIHRMMETLGFVVVKLQRVAFASLTFHGLRVGDARELTQLELNHLRDLAGLDRSAVARGKWRSRREDTDLTRREAERARLLAASPDGANSDGIRSPSAVRQASGPTGGHPTGPRPMGARSTGSRPMAARSAGSSRPAAARTGGRPDAASPRSRPSREDATISDRGRTRRSSEAAEPRAQRSGSKRGTRSAPSASGSHAGRTKRENR